MGIVVEMNGLLYIGDEIFMVNKKEVKNMFLDDVVILMLIFKKLILKIWIRKNGNKKNVFCLFFVVIE